MRIIKVIILLTVITIGFNSCFVKKQGKVNTDKNIKQEKTDLNFQYFFHEGNKQKMLGNYDQAVAYFIKCTELKPEEAAPYYELCGLSVSYGDLASAQKYAEKAYKIDSENKWYKIMLADVSKRRGDLKRTIELLNELASEYPDVSDYHMELAVTYMAMNRPKDAINEYELLEKNFGESELIAYEKERIYEKIGDNASSRKELEKLIRLNPSEANYYGMLAEAYLSIGNTSEAKKVYDMLLEIDPDNGIAFLSLSEYYRIMKQPDSSFIYLKKAFASDDVTIDTKIQILINNYVRTLNIGTNKEKALELLTIIEEKYPKEPRTYMIKADFLLQENRLVEASEQLKKSLALDKNNRNVWEQLLLIELDQHRFKELEIESKKALEYFPNYSNFYLMNGTALFIQQKYDEAITILKTGENYVINNEVQLMQFYIYIGDSYDRLKDYENSDLYFEKVLEIDPDNDLVLNNYSYYLSVRNEKLEKAETMSKRVITRNPGNATYIDTYAWILYKQKKYTDAIIYLERALKLGGDKNAAILEHYGDALYKNNEKEKALNAWEKAYELEPSEELKNRIENKSI